MITYTENGKEYKLPNSLTRFQRELYIHLINKKWTEGIRDPGTNKHKGELIKYDAILPEEYHSLAKAPHIYEPVRKALKQHHDKNPFRIHPHFYHMVSSQAANINLFLPLLGANAVNDILRSVKDDFASLAREELDNGYCIEYWGKNFGNNKHDKGLLADHNARTGTDSDIAIAYYNHKNELCLWLIEHKLTEKEFTECGGYKSDGRNKKKHLCQKSFSEILKNKDLCYYHNAKKYKYWEITEKHQRTFPNHSGLDSCPFKGGMNQLWRNHLLALALEDIGKFKHMYFSVVHHPGNKSLRKTIKKYQSLTNNSIQFSVLSSDLFVNAAEKVADKELKDWIDWYRDFYKI
ncbi:MAG: PGN_0703 family putative restriction endonuclease [Candidatus Rifleibacteriota bacterium]